MKFKSILFSALCLFSGILAAAQAKDTVRILAIGNEWGADVCTHDTYAYF